MESISLNILAFGSCRGKALHEYDVGKVRPIFPFCFLESKMVPGVPPRETGVVSEGRFCSAVLSPAEWGSE